MSDWERQKCDDPTAKPYEPPKRDYLVTATLQLVVYEPTLADAIIEVKALLNTLIMDSEYPMDPMNGAVVASIEDITA